MIYVLEGINVIWYFSNLFNAEVTIVPSKSWHTPDKPEETSLIGMLTQSRFVHKAKTTY